MSFSYLMTHLHQVASSTELSLLKNSSYSVLQAQLMINCYHFLGSSLTQNLVQSEAFCSVLAMIFEDIQVNAPFHEQPTRKEEEPSEEKALHQESEVFAIKFTGTLKLEVAPAD